MESDGGGKMRPKRNQSGNKPYDRKSSIFGRFSSSVKDLSQLLIPSWLAGDTSDNATKNTGQSSAKESRIGSEATGSQLVERLQSTPFLGPSTSSCGSRQTGSEKNKDSEEASSDGLSNRGNMVSNNSTSSFQQASVGIKQKSDSQLKMFDMHHDSRDDSNLNASEMRSIMVSTGSFSRSSQSEAKKQRLWSPEIARQGKPMAPPPTNKPAFNSMLFGSMSQSDVFGDSFRESSFYSGKTKFGGASAERRSQSMNKSLPYQSSLPLRKQVKANKMNSSYQAVTSSTAQRILETLDRMSTPLSDAKKIPQPETSNDSVLSFTPSSYRRTSLLGMNRSVTRPLQIPTGPPTKQYQTASPAEIRKNRYRPSDKGPNSSVTVGRDKPEESETEPRASTLFISQEQTDNQKDSTIKQRLSSAVGTLSSAVGTSGKMKSKKFSQHISKTESEEVPLAPALRTEFTLPVSSMTPISMPNFSVKSTPKALTSIPSSQSEVSPLKFTFSTPIQKSHGVHDLSNSNCKDFTFSSPIQASKTSAAGAEEPPKCSPEPAIGASSATSAPFSSSVTPAWGNTKAKPKGSSPDIGGTSSSFKSYSKWGENDSSAAAESPGMLAPASSLKKGSVMDILGGKSFSSSPTSSSTSKTDDLMAKFQKPAGDWECDTCMINNNASVAKCVACETPKPSDKKNEIQAPKETKLSNVVEISSDLLNKFKPSGNWECDTCMLSNKPEADKCVACEAARPGGSSTNSADIANNNSLSSLFKKPGGSWECDTCMVQNKETSEKCIACESAKPGLQSTTSVSKPTNGPTNSAVSLNPGGGFSFNLPTATSATTEGSGGFKFGNSVAKTTSPPSSSATGFVFGKTTDSKPAVNASESSSGGFKFGSSSNGDNSETKKQTSTFGAPASEHSSLSDSKASHGFQFGKSEASSIAVSSEPNKQSSSLFMKTSQHTDSKTNNDSSSTLGFQFSSTSNGPITNNTTVSNLTDSKKEVSSFKPPTISVAPTFSFGASSNSEKTSSSSTPSFSFSSQPPVTINPVAQTNNTPAPGLFSFGGSAGPASNNASAGLGMGKSLSDTKNSAPTMNGGFGSFLDAQPVKGKVEGTNTMGGFGSAPSSVFAFGQSAPSIPNSTTNFSQGPSAQKRSVDLNDTDHSSAKKSAGVKPAATNGLFAFGASSTPTFGSASSAAPPAGGFGGFGVPTPKAAVGAAPSAPGGGFGFGAAAPAFGQAPQQTAAPAFGTSTGQPAAGGFNFSSTPDFNFSSTGSSQSNTPFQFGGNGTVNPTPAPAAATGLFQFNSTPSANVAPAFGAAPAASAPAVGSFSIGASSDTTRRPIKKAIRKITKR